MGKDPAMPFYANDWLSSPQVQAMTPRQELAYFRLLLFSWSSQTASIPNDDDTLMALGRLDNKDDLTVVKRAFNETPNDASSLSNKRLFDVWQERQQWRQQRVDAGVKSGQARKLRRSNERSTSVQRDGNSSSSSSSSSNKDLTTLDLLAKYHDIGGLKQVRKLTKDRKVKAQMRCNSKGWKEAFMEAVGKLPIPGDGWQPDFDWLIANESNVYRVLEGRYDWRAERDAQPAKPKPTRISE